MHPTTAPSPLLTLPKPRYISAMASLTPDPRALDPEVLQPEVVDAGAKAGLREKIAPWAEWYVRLLDEAWRIPGTEIRVGIDPVLGLLMPGVGDVASALGGLAVLFLAVRHRVPGPILARMVWNVVSDTMIGAVPVVGDAFDLVWRSNRKNLDLIEKYRADRGAPRATPTTRDYVRIGAILFVISLAVLIPLAVAVALAGWLGAWVWSNVVQ